MKVEVVRVCVNAYCVGCLDVAPTPRRRRGSLCTKKKRRKKRINI
jgi:hypothetical protein